MPNFFAAMVLMYFLPIRLGVLPVVTNTDLGQSIILPTLTLAISMAAKYTRQVRATVLEELNKDYVTGARARGIRSRVIIWKSVMKASMLTIITPAGSVHRQSSGRNCHCGKYLYVGWCRKTGGRCDHHA